jgi:cystathionine beta-lyase/cystathionine gamma-synthase
MEQAFGRTLHRADIHASKSVRSARPYSEHPPRVAQLAPDSSRSAGASSPTEGARLRNWAPHSELDRAIGLAAPGWEAVEEALAAIEGPGASAVTFASGQAASMALMLYASG